MNEMNPLHVYSRSAKHGHGLLAYRGCYLRLLPMAGLCLSRFSGPLKDRKRRNRKEEAE